MLKSIEVFIGEKLEINKVHHAEGSCKRLCTLSSKKRL